MALVESSREAWQTGFLVFLRIGAAMSLLPAFGERSVPVRVRLVLTIAFTILVAPAVAPRFSYDALEERGRLVLLLSETMAGLTIGIGLRLLVFALQMAGTMAAQSVSLSQIFGGSPGQDPQPAIGHIIVIGGLALAVMAGLHVRLTSFLILSYDLIPAGQLPHSAMLAEWGIDKVGKAFALAFSLAAPFLVASLLYNIALGVINRAMPQLMVAFVGVPAITAGGLFLLLLILPLLLQVWHVGLVSFLEDPSGGLQ